MKILTLYDDNFGAENFLPPTREYCKKHGYTLIEHTERLSNRPISWDKIKLIEKVWKEEYVDSLLDSSFYNLGKWILWLDADAMILNHEIKLEDIIKEVMDQNPEADFIISRDSYNNENMGVFFIRQTSNTVNLLKDMWAQEDIINHQWWENAAFMRVYKKYNPTFIHHKKINIYPNEYETGDFILHFAGGNKLGRLYSMFHPEILKWRSK